MKTFLLRVFLIVTAIASAQADWPASSWNQATNLTSAMNPSGVVELSGLHWNSLNNRLYAVQNDGRLRVLQFNSATNTFTQIGNRTFDGGPEGITQVDLSANEFYTIDENDYEIRKYTHTANFSSVTESRHWNLLASPSPMEDTGNTGPEGIVFIPDNALSAAGFTSSETGQPYVSAKGMGGLLFIAHQDGGYIWVFDVNPNVNNDFAFVGKYKTSREESCDLAFDASTGLLYILHNLDDNYLEATNLELAPAAGGEPTFATFAEYHIANPDGSNVNIEGFALAPNCPDGGYAWLCRDASSGETTAVKQDVLRWFELFEASGNCNLGVAESKSPKMVLSPNPAQQAFSIRFFESTENPITVRVSNMFGQLALVQANAPEVIDISALPAGFYAVEVETAGEKFTQKLLKQ